jgi:hypothetical protein
MEGDRGAASVAWFGAGMILMAAGSGGVERWFYQVAQQEVSLL